MSVGWARLVVWGFGLGCVFLAPACGHGQSASPQLVEQLEQLYGESPSPIHFFATRIDLNDDQTAEWVVHVAGPTVCGTGGCDTLVFAEAVQGPVLVARIPLTRPPIVVATTSTHGWRDLIVHVSGGGINPGYDALLRYDGDSYPPNPTVPPAERLARSPKGQVAIRPFQSFTEGAPLRSRLGTDGTLAAPPPPPRP